MAGKSLQTRTSPTELSQLQATALHTELAQLESPTSSLELDTAQLEEASCSLSLVGPSFQTTRPQGGVVRGKLAFLTQLDLHKLELTTDTVAQASCP